MFMKSLLTSNPGLVKRNVSATALSTAPHIIHGRNLPNFDFVLSTIVPIIGSLMPSHIRARVGTISRKVALSRRTSVKYFVRNELNRP